MDGAMTDQRPLAEDELLDIVDEHDRVVGQALRAESYARRLRHRCVFVLARDPRGRIFVHRRTDRKLVFPSRYDMFVGGVVGAGETYDEAALREAEEELGVSGLPAPPCRSSGSCTKPPSTAGGRRCMRFGARCRSAPQEEEVAWHAFLSEAELAQRLGEWDWVPDGFEAYRRLRAMPSASGTR
ncbi:NUDIX domain-containing protein [Streptomyces olivoverticillatus]